MFSNSLKFSNAQILMTWITIYSWSMKSILLSWFLSFLKHGIVLKHIHWCYGSNRIFGCLPDINYVVNGDEDDFNLDHATGKYLVYQCSDYFFFFCFVPSINWKSVIKKTTTLSYFSHFFLFTIMSYIYNTHWQKKTKCFYFICTAKKIQAVKYRY